MQGHGGTDDGRTTDVGTALRDRTDDSLSKTRWPKARMKNVLASAALGFISGAIFWHVVGFWGFISDIVFRGRADGVPTAMARPSPPLKFQSRRTAVPAASSGVDTNQCSAVAIDRTGGEARIGACDPTVTARRSVGAIARSDFGDFGPVPVPTIISGRDTRETAVGGWSARIDTAEDRTDPD